MDRIDAPDFTPVGHCDKDGAYLVLVTFPYALVHLSCIQFVLTHILIALPQEVSCSFDFVVSLCLLFLGIASWSFKERAWASINHTIPP